MAGPTVTLTFAGDADKLNRAFDSVGASAKSMETNVGSAGNGIRDTSGRLHGLGESADGAESKFQGFSDILSGGMDGLRALSDDSLSTGERLQMLGMAGADLAGGIASFLVPALSAGVTGIKAMSLALLTSPITWIVLGIGLIVGAFILLWNNVEGFRNFWIGAWEGIKGFASGAIDGIMSIVKGFANLIVGIFTLDFGRAKDGAIAAFGGLLRYVTTIPRLILGALGNLGSLLLGAGGDLLRGLWNGISGAASWLLRQVGRFFGNLLPGWVEDMLGISSPSKVFAELGQYIPEGLAVGIEGNLAPIEDASVSMGNAAMGDYMAGAGSFSSRGSGGAGVAIEFNGNVDSAFASAFMKLVRTGQIQLQAA